MSQKIHPFDPRLHLDSNDPEAASINLGAGKYVLLRDLLSKVTINTVSSRQPQSKPLTAEFACPLCSTVFSTSPTLVQHVPKHWGVKGIDAVTIHPNFTLATLRTLQSALGNVPRSFLPQCAWHFALAPVIPIAGSTSSAVLELKNRVDVQEAAIAEVRENVQIIGLQTTANEDAIVRLQVENEEIRTAAALHLAITMERFEQNVSSSLKDMKAGPRVGIKAKRPKRMTQKQLDVARSTSLAKLEATWKSIFERYSNEDAVGDGGAVDTEYGMDGVEQTRKVPGHKWEEVYDSDKGTDDEGGTESD